MIRKSARLASLVGVLFALSATVASAADCRADLVASQQSLERTRAGIQSPGPSDAQRCAAYRRHHASLVHVREVFSRCDTGAQKTERAAQLTASINDFRAKMPPGCRP